MAEASKVDGGVFDVEAETFHSSGQIITVRIVGKVIHGEGKPAYMEGTLTDLREQRAMRGG